MQAMVLKDDDNRHELYMCVERTVTSHNQLCIPEDRKIINKKFTQYNDTHIF